jgi:hypothetical protein
MDDQTGQNGRKLFNRFQLTLDKKTAKYLPYSEVVYPKLQHGMDKSKSAAELEAMWMVGFVDQEKQISNEKSLQQLKLFLELPENNVPPVARERLAKIYKKRKPPDLDSKKSTVSMHPDDEYRLEQLVAMEKPKRAVGQRKINPGKRAYMKENKKIQKMRVLKRPGVKKNVVDAEGLDDLFELERQHTHAALVVQAAWRHYLARNFWKSYMEKVRASTAVQRIARGMITRELVMLWHIRRTHLVTLVQACARSKISRRVQRTIDAWEKYNTRLIQNMVRRNQARKRARLKKGNIASTRIQCLWRGIAGRAMADRIALNNHITKLCALARGHLGRKGYRIKKRQMCKATITVQRYFRGSLGRTWRNNFMFERESAYRKELLEMLAVEAEWAAEHRNKLIRSLSHRGYDPHIDDYSKRMDNLVEDIRQHEYDFLELKRELGRLSPRAVQQDWGADLTKNIDQHRKWITEKKHNALFVTGLKLKQMEERRQMWRDRIEKADWDLQEINRWRESELSDMFARESRNKWGAHFMDMQRKKVADQRRRWEVKHYTATGKPDKKRRPGRPWDPTVYAGQERDVFSLENGNILADIDDGEEDHSAQLGSESSIAKQTNRIENANMTNHIQQFNALVAPLYKHMDGSVIKEKVRRIRDPPAPPSKDWKKREVTRVKTEHIEKITVTTKPKPKPKPKRQHHKKLAKVRASAVPWKLLDELEAEKAQLQKDKDNKSHLMNKD